MQPACPSGARRTRSSKLRASLASTISRVFGAAARTCSARVSLPGVGQGPLGADRLAWRADHQFAQVPRHAGGGLDIADIGGVMGRGGPGIGDERPLVAQEVPELGPDQHRVLEVHPEPVDEDEDVLFRRLRQLLEGDPRWHRVPVPVLGDGGPITLPPYDKLTIAGEAIDLDADPLDRSPDHPSGPLTR